jgi:23S rRNA (adenine2503-C2)-methyltransferase
LPYRRPADEDLARFIDTLRRSGVSVKVRKRKGSEIDAACGQLRREVEAQTNHRDTETQRKAEHRE